MTTISTDRRQVKITRAEAKDFLNRVLTCRTDDISDGDVRFGALLTPQGKIIADLFVFGVGSDLVISLPAETADDVCKRLTMLKLRADVNIEQAEDIALVFSATSPEKFPDMIHCMQDPRIAAKLWIGLRKDKADQTPDDKASWAELRIQQCLPECGADYAPASAFPADVNMDILSGIDFKKGCFVGQEVVSRMKRKTEVRKRTVKVYANTTAEPGFSLMSGESTIGEIQTWQGHHGLAFARLDRLSAAQTKGDSLMINDQSAEIILPDGVEFPSNV